MGQMLSNLGTKDNPLSWKNPQANKPSFLKPKRMKQTVVSEQGEPEYSERQKMISSWDMNTENNYGQLLVVIMYQGVCATLVWPENGWIFWVSITEMHPLKNVDCET